MGIDATNAPDGGADGVGGGRGRGEVSAREGAAAERPAAGVLKGSGLRKDAVAVSERRGEVVRWDGDSLGMCSPGSDGPVVSSGQDSGEGSEAPVQRHYPPPGP